MRSCKRLCRCGGVVDDNTCSRCGPKRESQRPNHKRYGTDGKKLYGYRWEQFRTRFLSCNPLCVDCEDNGRVAIANEVHHVIKVSQRPDLMYDEGNCLPLCESCHSKRTRRGE